MSKAEPQKRGGWKQSEHQKQIARKTMLKLRHDQPEKFGKTKKPKVQPENPTAEVQPQPQPEPPPAPAHTPPPPQPSPPPMEMPSHQDTELFGTESPPPPKLETTPEPPTPPPNTPGTPTATAATATPDDVRKYGVLIWQMIVKIFVAIFGEGFNPITVKSGTGEILYDENAEGVKVWTNYLVSIGVKVFSPIVELWMFMAAYVTIRFPVIVARFRRKKKPEAEPGTKSEPTPTEPPKTETAQAPPAETQAPPTPKLPPLKQNEATEAAEEWR